MLGRLISFPSFPQLPASHSFIQQIVIPRQWCARCCAENWGYKDQHKRLKDCWGRRTDNQKDCPDSSDSWYHPKYKLLLLVTFSSVDMTFWGLQKKKVSCLQRNDSKEIKPIHPKGNQPWIFIRRTDAEAEALVLWPPDAKRQLTG